jgi:hypothetical protein
MSSVISFSISSTATAIATLTGNRRLAFVAGAFAPDEPVAAAAGGTVLPTVQALLSRAVKAFEATASTQAERALLRQTQQQAWDAIASLARRRAGVVPRCVIEAAVEAAGSEEGRKALMAGAVPRLVFKACQGDDLVLKACLHSQGTNGALRGTARETEAVRASQTVPKADGVPVCQARLRPSPRTRKALGLAPVGNAYAKVAPCRARVPGDQPLLDVAQQLLDAECDWALRANQKRAAEFARCARA